MVSDRRGTNFNRPSIDIGVSLKKWNVFTRRWEAFRQGSGMAGKSTSTHLFQCATKILVDNLNAVGCT